MHAAAPAARAARLSAVQFGHQLTRRQSLGQGVAVAAVGAEDRVIRTQVSADADGDGLLADVSVAGAVDQAALVRPGQLFLTLANDLHLAIQTRQKLRTVFGAGREDHDGCFSP